MVLYINGNYPNHSLHSELIYKLAELGNKITVFVPMRGKNEEQYSCQHPNVNVVYNDCLNYVDRVFFISKTYKIAKVVEEQVDLSKVECILAGTIYSDGAVAYLLHKRHNIPFSVAVRETDVTYQMKYRPYLNIYIKKLLNRATNIIFLSPAYKQYIKKFCMNQDKFIVIPNAVNDYWFQHQEFNRVLHDPYSLIFVGEISRRKNVSTAILAVSELNKRKIKTHLHIIGSGSEEKKCRDLVEKLELHNQVFFHGWQKGKENIRKFYDQADIFIMLSHKETFGTVYVEALTQGLPIVYTKGQGIDGYFTNGSIGYGCNPKNINEIADKIKMIIENYDKISIQCTQQCQIFTWEKVANQYNEVIRKMRGQ